MTYKELLHSCLPYLRLLINPIIDAEVAVVLLADTPMDIIYGLQTVLIIGMICIEEDLEDASVEPNKCFAKMRHYLPTNTADPIWERAYLTQPNYVEYFIRGMAYLQLT